MDPAKPLIDKLGVKPGARVLLLGLDGDRDFHHELTGRGAEVSVGGRATGLDFVFLRVEQERDLDRLASLRRRITSAGAIWVIHPKGRKDLSHDVLVAGGKRAGLIDNKSVRFSETHAGLRFVIPLAERHRE